MRMRARIRISRKKTKMKTKTKTKMMTTTTIPTKTKTKTKSWSSLKSVIITPSCHLSPVSLNITWGQNINQIVLFVQAWGTNFIPPLTGERTIYCNESCFLLGNTLIRLYNTFLVPRKRRN